MTNATKASSLQYWSCGHCGVECSRVRVRGQRPKWCSQRCADLGKKGSRGSCLTCGADFFGLGAKYCSVQCVGASRRGSSEKRRMTPEELATHYLSMRSPLRAAIEDGDEQGLRVALDGKTERNADGCMVWTGRLSRDGYPRARVGGREVMVHRAVLEVIGGAPLGVQQAHHVCANAACVNPDHLLPATHVENIAEMKARNSYLDRIGELEDALRGVAPDHPALNVLPFI